MVNPRRPIVPLLSALLTALLVCLAISTANAEAASKRKVYKIAGVGTNSEGKSARKDQLSFKSSGISISIRYLDDSTRKAALASVLGEEVNLFPEHPEDVRGHLVFALEIQNDSDGDLLFEPGQSRILTDRHDAEFPFDYTLLYQLLERFRRHPDGRGWRLEEVEKAVYSRAMSIKPGGAVLKLLVFREPLDERFKKIQVRIGALHLSNSDIDATFTFKKFKVKDQK